MIPTKQGAAELWSIHCHLLGFLQKNFPTSFQVVVYISALREIPQSGYSSYNMLIKKGEIVNTLFAFPFEYKSVLSTDLMTVHGLSEGCGDNFFEKCVL